jgi:hypothetical protein
MEWIEPSPIPSVGEWNDGLTSANNTMRTKQHSELINDEQSLVSAQFQHGTPIQTYDDGFGPIFILRDSMGIQGIIRAQSWEDAYEIAEDEMFPDCDLTMEEIVKEYGFQREHVKMIHDPVKGWREVAESDYSDNGKIPEFASIKWETRETLDAESWSENELFCEAYGFRPNGARSGSTSPMSHIYAKDLNGESLDILTPSLVAGLGIILNIETNE